MDPCSPESAPEENGSGLIKADGPPYAECVLCREPTEYAEASKGLTLCPVCAWREAERTACSG